MDCVTAQQLVSDAMDKLPVDAEALRDAKWHCNECDECGAFVRAMLAVQRAPLPPEPAGLADRIIERVREEANASAYARARALAEPVPAAVSAILPDVVDSAPLPRPAGLSSVFPRLNDPRTRNSAIAWLTSAALLVVLTGWGAIVGVRSILAPTNDVVEFEYMGTDGATAPQGAVTSPESSGAQNLSTGAKAPQAPMFLTLDSGLVYHISGPAGDVDDRQLIEAGETETDLGTKAVRGAALFKTPTGEMFVEDEEGNLQIIESVQLVYDGATFDLVSKPIESVSSWPALPADLDTPRSPDGSPTFQRANDKQDDGVFVLRGSTIAEGIALPPNTQMVALLSACPDWTFWTPHK